MNGSVTEAEERLDQLFVEAFSTNEPAMLDWVAVKLQLKKLRHAALLMVTSEDKVHLLSKKYRNEEGAVPEGMRDGFADEMGTVILDELKASDEFREALGLKQHGICPVCLGECSKDGKKCQRCDGTGWENR